MTDLWFDMLQNEAYSKIQKVHRTYSDELEDQVDEKRLSEMEAVYYE